MRDRTLPLDLYDMKAWNEIEDILEEKCNRGGLTMGRLAYLKDFLRTARKKTIGR